MKQEELIRKLENLKTPDVELPGHKQALRMALLNSGCFREKTIMDWARILAPISAAVILIAVVGFFNVIQPQLQMAQAKAIASSDLQVQALMEEHKLDIAEVKLQDGEALVLLAPQFASGLDINSQSSPDGLRIFRWILPLFPKPSELTSGEVLPTSPGELSPGYILKVDLLEKKVSECGEIDEATALKDINLEDIDFVKFGPTEGAPSEGAEPE
ncbi:MAG TPA: hypothetical protein ENN57_00600 [Chloroflexi bacterium]|nr:hypothetical protein [Chloroflexota bacterium]